MFIIARNFVKQKQQIIIFFQITSNKQVKSLETMQIKNVCVRDLISGFVSDVGKDSIRWRETVSVTKLNKL